jgi:hypothetical protein
MKLAKSTAPAIVRTNEGRTTSPEIRICFSYVHTDAPLDGSNTFLRALREHVSRVAGFTIVDNLHDEFDVLFMNQLSRSPGNAYALSEIHAALTGKEKRKLVVRAINLKAHDQDKDPIQNPQHDLHDRATIDLLNMADFVIFQSHFQKRFFDRFGFKGKNCTIIHNGASSVFLDVPGGPKKFEASEDLILLSSAMETKRVKRHEIIVALSLVPGVRVIHSGSWPANMNQGKVELAGVLSHDEMVQLYECGHYFLHPAVRDVCPNSLIEGLCAGLPAIYNPSIGSGSELAGNFGIALDENDLPGTIARARSHYERLATALTAERHYYSIERAAHAYLGVFKSVAEW